MSPRLWTRSLPIASGACHIALPVALTFAAAIAPCSARAATLYGVTATDLVTIQPATGATTVIGSLGLAANQTAGPLAWHSGEAQLYGLIYDYTVVGGLPVPTQQQLVRINPSTGSWTSVATLGNPAANPTFDAIEYFDHLGSLVVSRSAGAGQTSTAFLDQISPTGVRTPLVTTGIDNDLLAYDPGASRAYSVDPNGLQEIRVVNTSTGTHTPLGGGLPSTSTGELAYDLGSDRLYALDYALLPTPNRNLYTLDTAGGAGPVSFTTAAVTDIQVRGIAFAAVPELPGTVSATGVLLAAWLVARRARPTPNAGSRA
jgi:hypothetical protein